MPEKLQPYIGIITRPAGPELTAQVRLPEGFGLIVEDVLPDSPAQGAGLQRNDLLIRFDDQWLANPPQLEALVRRAGKDKEASLTVLRGGQEQRLTVRIGEKMLPERRGWPGGGFPEMPFGAHGGGFGEQRPQPRPGHVEEQRERRTNYATDRARVVRKDEQGEYELNKADGKRTFVVRKLDGEVVWQGEVGTDEQRQRVPAEWRGKLELMEKTPGLDRLKQEERRSER